MIDPLSCLREYIIKKQPIIQKNNFVIFGEYCWPKSVKTNYQIFNKQEDSDKEYYTLECLLFLLSNSRLNHVTYVNFAREKGVPYIRRPDRKKLLAYLSGEVSTSPSIDSSAPVEPPTKIKLEHQKEIIDVMRDPKFRRFTLPSSEADISENNSQSFSNHDCAVVGKTEPTEQDDINTRPDTKELSVPSSTETNSSRNQNQFSSFQRVKRVKDNDGKINKKQRNEVLEPSSEGDISENNSQSFSNHECAVVVKTEPTEQDDISTRPGTKKLSVPSSTEIRNQSKNQNQFSSFPRVTRVKDNDGKINKKQRNEFYQRR